MALSFAQEDAEEELLAKALYVDNNDDGSGPFDATYQPSTAEDYLKGVMREAKSMGEVSIAKNANKFRSNVVSIAIREKATLKESGTVLPPIEWQHNQVAEFSKVRIQLARHIAYSQTKERSPDKKRHKLPSKTNEQGWCTYCYGKDFWKVVAEAKKKIEEEEGETIEDTPENSHNKPSSAFNDMAEGQAPLTSIITQLKHTEIVSLLDFQIEWIELIGIKIEDQGLWIYALMTSLEKPPHPDVTSSLRSLALACSRQRKDIFESPSKDIVRAEDQATWPKFISHLNLIICLVARYFDQADLADSHR